MELEGGGVTVVAAEDAASARFVDQDPLDLAAALRDLLEATADAA